MKDIFVKLGSDSYHIVIGQGIIDQIEGLISKLDTISLSKNSGRNKIVIITDENVARLYSDSLTNGLSRMGFLVKLVSIAPGEDQKNLSTAERLYETFFEHRMDRKSLVVALGGGVVGDLSGFAASTFMRGIPYIQIPTTLLAQVDSSVGGKTGVNHPKGKNMIGSFYQPKGVFIDTAALTTLPRKELIAGLVEVIKYGVIRSKPLFEYIENSLSGILELSEDAIEHIVFNSCRIKTEIVEEDEKEEGIRAILNYGHTIGHAIEALTNYCQYRHGEAVGIGMIYASKIAREMGLADDSVISRQRTLLERMGLSTEIADINPSYLMTGYSTPTQIVERLYQDKKTIGGKLRFILPVQIGKVIISDKVSEDIIYKVLND